jgi:hypothetical protein
VTEGVEPYAVLGRFGVEERMPITDSLKAQLATLVAQRREHEKAVNVIKRNEIKVRKAIAQLASLPAPVSQS